MSGPSISARRLTRLLGASHETSPAYQGLADGLRLLVADGQISAGTRLPSERDLVAALGLSRTTVTRAYAVLRESGYATSRQGSGTVAALPDAGRRHTTPLSPSDPEAAREVIDLTCASLPAAPGTAAAYEEAIRSLPAYLGGDGYHPLGLPDLRQRIAERFTARGVATTADQVMVTGGAVAGLAIVTRALVGQGDRVLTENPTYPNAIVTLRQAGARLVPVAMPREGGWDLPGLEATVAQTAPRAAYLMPDFHNPTGALMGDDDRRRLGDILTAARTLAVVDETMADIPHDPEVSPPRPLAALVAHSVTLGTTSKSHWGGLRIGWIRAPRGLMPALTQARLTLDLGSPVLEQLVLLDLLDRVGDVRSARAELLRTRRAALVDSLAEALPAWRPRPAAGGLAAWVDLPDPISTTVTLAAERRGLLLAPGPQFSVDGGMERQLRLPFTRPPQVLRDAVARLTAADAEARSTGRARTAQPRPLIA